MRNDPGFGSKHVYSFVGLFAGHESCETLSVHLDILDTLDLVDELHLCHPLVLESPD